MLDVEPQVWDLHATVTAVYFDKTDPDEPIGIIHANQTLVVKVTIVLSGKSLHYLCDTELCVCLAYDACGIDVEGQICKTIKLEGEYDPCNTGTFVFKFEIPPNTLTAGDCGTQYDICLTISSKDCCGDFGFLFGCCKDFDICVLPPTTEPPGE
ncbi:MAG: hypothetical protein ACRDQ4_16230 [Pseudonocardiaceae bacterium]